ncbi:MAG: dihydropyrimidinase [Oligoflexia bacterium]|nr:dihydropyrimidinase [Oligoflexia bacterium]
MNKNSTSILIKNGTVVSSSSQVKANILIVDGKIKKIGDMNISEPEWNDITEVIDASNLLIFPGGIDAHTHMELPVMGISSSDTFATGTRAALYGGTTTIIDFANQNRNSSLSHPSSQTEGESLNHTLDKWFKKAEGNVYTDYGLHLSVTVINTKTLDELKGIVENRGVSSFKTFMAYPNMRISDDEIATLMREANKLGGLVTVHAEDGQLIESLIEENIKERNISPKMHPLNRPTIAETNAISRLIDISNKEQLPIYVVHLSSADGLNKVRENKGAGPSADAGVSAKAKIILETCPQYLVLDDSKYLHKDPLEINKFVMSPPLRESGISNKNQNELWKGIAEGYIQVVATDHCPFTLEQKKLGINNFTMIPNGIPGVEHRLEILFSEGFLKGKITLEQLVKVWATNPANIFGLYPQKGDIVVGADADLVLFDPSFKHTLSVKNHHMNVDYSAYEGFEVTGKCKCVILRGKVVIDNNGTLKINQGYGKYLHRNRCLHY